MQIVDLLKKKKVIDLSDGKETLGRSDRVGSDQGI
jgi:hypothetical protein